MDKDFNGISLMQGDCLERMKEIEDKSIDMILCDLPYGQLNKKNPLAKWDTIISFDKLWEQYNRVIKDNGCIVLFGNGMFTAKLMLSNEKYWRYNLIWKKGDRTSGFLNSKRMPLRNHEDICVFYKKLPIYHPQMKKCEPYKKNHSKGNLLNSQKNSCYGDFVAIPTIVSDEKYPKSIINIHPEHKEFLHPTQKPVELLEWLIKTYTDENNCVLDNCMGSGSTGIACVNTNRKFIGIEMDENYFNIACNRIDEAIIEKEQSLFK